MKVTEVSTFYFHLGGRFERSTRDIAQRYRRNGSFLRHKGRNERENNAHAATPTLLSEASRRRAPVRFITTSSSDTPAR